MSNKLPFSLPLPVQLNNLAKRLEGVHRELNVEGDCNRALVLDGVIEDLKGLAEALEISEAAEGAGSPPSTAS